MEEKPPISLTYCPCPDETCAKALGQLLLEQHVAACVQIIPGIQSMYWWQGVIETSSECGLLIKSSSEKNQAIMNLLEQQHPYDCPCILQHAVSDVNPAYREWLEKNI